jgi:hypothetical protein
MNQTPLVHKPIWLEDGVGERPETTTLDPTRAASSPHQLYGGTSSFSDGSGALFHMYVKISEEEDNKMVDRWQKDADGILIFVSLYIGFHTASQHPT